MKGKDKSIFTSTSSSAAAELFSLPIQSLLNQQPTVVFSCFSKCSMQVMSLGLGKEMNRFELS